jgi:hypothetical protein
MSKTDTITMHYLGRFSWISTFSDLQFSENLVPPLMMLVNACPRIQDVSRPNQKQLYTGNYSRKMAI